MIISQDELMIPPRSLTISSRKIVSTHLKTIISRDELMITARFLTISVRQNHQHAPRVDHLAARIDDHVPFSDNLAGKTISTRRELMISRDELMITSRFLTISSGKTISTRRELMISRDESMITSSFLTISTEKI